MLVLVFDRKCSGQSLKSMLPRRYFLLHPDDTWHGAPELPKAAVALLDKDFTLSTSTVEQQQVSSDGTTTKLLVRLQDGMQVEAVVMTYTKGGACLLPVALPSYSAPALLHIDLLCLREAGYKKWPFSLKNVH